MTADQYRGGRRPLLVVTFVVAFCSFAYEFVYSELLTVLYGGTVTQYTLTIGLYFFALGVGSSLSDDLDPNRPANFTRIEVALAAIAPAGFLGIVALSTLGLPPAVEGILARVPPVIVGFLSGFELPLLTALVEAESDDDPSLLPTPVRSSLARLHAGVVALLGTVFQVDRTGKRSGLSIVLAMDYLGGLVGAVIYATVLYPDLGLVATVFALSLLNVVAALLFVVRFGSRWRPTRQGATATSAERGRVIAVLLVLSAAYVGVLATGDVVDDAVTEIYVEGRLQAGYSDAVDVSVTSTFTTAYQNVVTYDREWTSDRPNGYFAGDTDTCLGLGTAVQVCESWVEGYHAGLVDVPASMYPEGPDTRVLVIGGGDWIAVDRLRERDVTVDLVDIDREFMDYARDAPLLARHHDDAYRYERLDVTVGDGYAYLGETDERYDLILLDVPGATDSDLLHLYSREFYQRLRGHLTENGTVATWTYDRHTYPGHHAAYLTTVRAAGFDAYLPYWGYEDVDDDGTVEPVERFYVLAAGDRPEFSPETAEGYVARHRDRYADARFRPLPGYRGVRASSVFRPNYDLLIDR
ncbi:spermidine synthase [Halobacteriales archaeon SW_7_68_16]|nr:MAG: spermidine synthase [Halobacteriales archaeon SW_7_68_16]